MEGKNNEIRCNCKIEDSKFREFLVRLLNNLEPRFYTETEGIF